jgi:hypothetical protein
VKIDDWSVKAYALDMIKKTQRKLLLDNTEAVLKEGKPQRNPGESQADFLKRTLYK